MGPLDRRTGAYKLLTPQALFVWVGVVYVVAKMIAKAGFAVGAGLVALPFAIGFLVMMFKNPRISVITVLIMGFMASGISRYVKAIPWGLTLDAFLFLGWLAILFQKFRETDWTPIKNDLMWLTLLWMGYIFFEVVNPEARSAVAWFYAMRGIGFYWLLGFGIVFFYFRDVKDLDKFLNIIVVISILGMVWGMRQKVFGTDAAEDHWLYAEEHADQHVLFGVLRVFSFYTDAGQFGASQAMMALLCGIIAIGPGSMKKRIWYGFAALCVFIGFGISGTRGALAVPAAGGIIFLIMTKNFKVLVLGLVAGFLVFGMLKYTMALQSVEQIARMRTALDPDNPSLNARFHNQVIYRKYLKTRPIGAGVGTAGFWGQRFSPGTIPAETPTDSWYVRIWAETGIVGLIFHVYWIGYFLGKGGNITWNLKNQELRYKIMAIYSAYGGIAIASYGNMVLGQIPTGIILCFAFPMIWMAPMYDEQLENQDRQDLRDAGIDPDKDQNALLEAE
ncbi:MAG: O-antigen ligase family protein [Bacteroidia bacterium]|nr:O-antigen ligase family protein [Bacteroidia bacterium]